MAITDQTKGVWSLDEVYNKIAQGSIWTYQGVEGRIWFSGAADYGLSAKHYSPGSAYVNTSSPIQILGSADAPYSKLFTMGSCNSEAGTAAAALESGTLYMWGKNQVGECGTNSVVPQNNGLSSPVQVPGTTWSDVGIGYKYVVATKTDGTLWTWGDSDNGTLGRNEGPGNNFSSPTQLPGGTWGSTLGKTGIGNRSNVNVKTNGTLWVWGTNNYGTLGLNDRTERSSPTQVGTDTDWEYVCPCVHDSMYAIKTNGSLWAWGYGTQGQLGLNESTSCSSPTQVGTDTNWACTQTGHGVSSFVKTNGELYMVGGATYGSLGMNDQVKRSSPTQLPGTWSANHADQHGPFWSYGARKADGTVWMWGYNHIGEGRWNGARPTQLSSPVQIGAGTAWAGNTYAAWVKRRMYSTFTIT